MSYECLRTVSVATTVCKPGVLATLAYTCVCNLVSPHSSDVTYFMSCDAISPNEASNKVGYIHCTSTGELTDFVISLVWLEDGTEVSCWVASLSLLLGILVVYSLYSCEVCCCCCVIW